MKKRYHHSKAKKGLHDLAAHEFYAGAANKNRQEYEDSQMIYENHSAIANLPQEVMIKHYPSVSGYMPAGLDDGISGIDRQMSKDNSQKMIHLSPRKN